MFIREGAENDNQEPGDLPIRTLRTYADGEVCGIHIYMYSSRHANISYRVGDVFLH